MARALRRFAILLIAASAGALAAAPFTEHTLRYEPGDAPPAASMDAMAWLAGRWRAPAFGGMGEEVWLPAADGAMVGVFRHRGDAGASFYEILVIREQDASLILQLKHFDPDLRGWEAADETVDFPLVALAPDRVDFEGMRFERAGPDAMTVFLAVDEGAAEVRFDYERY